MSRIPIDSNNVKRYSYGQIIAMSWKWMVEILFRPFNLKKWIVLTIVLFLAGQMGAGLNLNSNMNNADLNKFKSMLRAKGVSIDSGSGQYGAIQVREFLSKGFSGGGRDFISKIASFFNEGRNALVIPLIVFLIISPILLFIILWIWIQSNFSFVLIDSIARNDASLRVPFHRNKSLGNSFFRWQLTLAAAFWFLSGTTVFFAVLDLRKRGIFSGAIPIQIGKILSVVMPYVPIFIFVFTATAVAAFFTYNFILPIMYKKRVGVLNAWSIFLGALKRNIGSIVLYVILKFVLLLISLIAMLVLALLGVLAIILIGGLLALIGVLIHSILPAGVAPIAIIVFSIFAIPVFILMGLFFSMLFIPFPLFFRVFSIYVIGNIDKTLDIFAPKTDEELRLEGDDEKYEKSMRLVWFIVLSPFLIVILGIVLAIAMPNMIKSKWAGSLRPRRKTMLLKKDIRTKDENVSKAEDSLPKDLITVYLKNGNSFQAVISSETEDNIEFKIEGGVFVLPRNDILRIE